MTVAVTRSRKNTQSETEPKQGLDISWNIKVRGGGGGDAARILRGRRDEDTDQGGKDGGTVIHQTNRGGKDLWEGWEGQEEESPQLYFLFETKVIFRILTFLIFTFKGICWPF